MNACERSVRVSKNVAAAGRSAPTEDASRVSHGIQSRTGERRFSCPIHKSYTSDSCNVMKKTGTYTLHLLQDAKRIGTKHLCTVYSLHSRRLQYAQMKTVKRECKLNLFCGYFWRCPNFFIIQNRWNETIQCHAKTSSISSVVSIQYKRVMDRRTDLSSVDRRTDTRRQHIQR